MPLKSVDARREYQRRYYEKNRDRFIQNQRDWYSDPENKEKLRNWGVSYRAENKEAIQVRKAQYWNENKDRIIVKQREWYRESEKAKQTRRKNYIKRTFKMSVEQYESMLAAQDYKCAICRKDISGGKHALDHCHETGKVREFLCGPCNSGIGFFGDNPSMLSLAHQYLTKHA